MNVFIYTFENLKNNPIKAIIMFLSVGLGVAILIFALSISQLFNQLLDEKVNGQGIVLTVSNTQLQADGSYDRVRPLDITLDAADILKNSVEGAKHATVIVRNPFTELTVNSKKYNIRKMVGSTKVYFDVFGLSVIDGVLMSDADVTNSAKKMWISESTASILFGSTANAIGQKIEPPTFNFARRNQNSRVAPTIYTVAGVFKDPDELKRKVYSIADVVIPYTASLPSGDIATRILARIASTFVVSIENNPNADAQIRSAMALEYGDDIQLNVWEGDRSGPSVILQDIRDSVAVFTFVINLLGFILLISGTIGILSIMMVEILNKKREIAIERALGAAFSQIVSKFLMQSVILSGLSAVVGVVLVFVIATPLAATVLSVFDGLDSSDISGNIVQPMAILIGFLSALLFGGVLGVLPLFGFAKQSISEALRDV
ncbi:MAG: ABC transporter permease [Saccharospirillaceae bacterium]|nr:ABC transporter permease [Saccharospirillaceae bacterium]